MVSQQIIDIIIKAEDMASEQAKKVEEKFKQIGTNGQAAFDKVSKTSDNANQKLAQMHEKLSETVNNVNKVGNEGANSFRKLTKEEQDAVIKFNTLDKEIQLTLQTLRELGSTDCIPNAEGALNAFSRLNSLTRSWSGSLDYAKTKMQLLGNDTTSLRGKIQTTGMAIQTYLGTKCDSVKTKVTSVAETIRGKIGSAIDSVKAKLGGLGGGFDKLSSGATSAGQSLGFLRNAASMTVGMIGYDLVNSMVECTRASLNARSSIQAFASRLGMSSSEVDTFQASLDKLQLTYKKIDMDVVGLPKQSLNELTETTAIFVDAMQRNGRSAEDSMLAMSDAMDGQFQRLKEIGISEKDLMNNGWSGDLQDKTGLLQAMNQALKDQHYDELAKGVDNLDDAWQVLTITLSNLLESILVPLTPAIIGIISSFSDVVGSIMGFIRTLQNAWTNMPDWAQLALGLTAVGIAAGILGTILLSEVVPGMVASAISTINWIATALGAEVSAFTLSGAFTLLGTTIWAALAPLLPFIAAAALLVVAVYEVGKAFGWWNDVGGMIDAIRSGIMRLWDAFINHPDVQGAIKAIGDALKWISDGVTWAGQQVLRFFHINSPHGGKWDIISALIHGVGDAWNALKGAVGWVIGVFQNIYNSFNTVMNVLGPFGSALLMLAGPVGSVVAILRTVVCILLGCSPGIVPALQKVQEVFSSVWNAIAGFIGGVISTIISGLQPIIDILTEIGEFIIGQFMESWNAFVSIINIVQIAVNLLISIFQQFMDGQISLTTALSMVWNVISSMFATVLNIIVQRVISFGSSLISNAIRIASNFVNNIVTRISQLPGKVASYMSSTLSRIISIASQWVSNAVNKASSLVSSVASTLSSLPGKISSALSGVVNAIVKPFKDAYTQVKGIVDDIIALGGEIAFGGDVAYGGDSLISQDVNLNKLFNINTGEIVNTLETTKENTQREGVVDKLEIEINENLKLDLINVPAHIDENALIKMLDSTTVLKALTSNRKFQDLDNQIKSEIAAKAKRASGG